MERKAVAGQHVIYIDSQRVAHHALVTHTWPGMSDGNRVDGCNLLYVCEDPDRRDQYGSQIERQTSVVHMSQQPGGGVAWCFESELSDHEHVNTDRIG